MNKEELFQELSSKISTGEIQRDELVSRFGFSSVMQGGSKAEVSSNSATFSVTKMLYFLGAAIAVVGIIIFVSQIWSDIGSFGRISVTLGLGFVITAVGSLLLNQKPNDNIGSVFHFIGGMLVPGGAMVTLTELSTGQDTLWPVAFTFGVVFVFYLLLNFVHKTAILTFFAIANGTAFVYLLVGAITDGSIYMNGDLYAYLTMVIGVSYILLAYAFREGWNNKLVWILYNFGITGFLGAAFTQVFDSVIWQMLYFLLIILGFFIAVSMKSRGILTISTLFLIGHVSYITSEYFADSIGWPISLVILGFVFIALGYASISINKNYIAK